MKSEKLLFVGDSLIEYFDWQVRFPEHDVMNSGTAGETVSGLLNRAERIVNHEEQPDWCLIMSGTNNVVMEDYSFIPLYEKIIEVFLDAFPKAAIIINSLMPIRMDWLSQTAIPRMNSSLYKLSQKTGTGFLDVFDLFVKKQADGKTSLFLPDGVHLNETGYRVWSDAVADKIK
ncbi:MAG: GDSL family lipase [Desulfobulbaceae bacterium]|nr:GDSL family lipase [Desulfobulbaceae bacterium]